MLWKRKTTVLMVLALGVVVSVLLGCGDKNGDEEVECRKPVVISQDFPIAVKYAEVGLTENCPTPVIGDVMESLRDEVRARCAEGSCEDEGVECVPKNTNVTIIRQEGQYEKIVGDRKECWVVVVAEVDTKCICEE